jgi:hypothetical protein
MKTLAEIVVGAAAFLEFASDEILDPDDAVQQLEDIGFQLLQASPAEKQAVLEVCRAIVEAMPANADAHERAFYKDFGENFGIIPDDPDA